MGGFRFFVFSVGRDFWAYMKLCPILGHSTVLIRICNTLRAFDRLFFSPFRIYCFQRSAQMPMLLCIK